MGRAVLSLLVVFCCSMTEAKDASFAQRCFALFVGGVPLKKLEVQRVIHEPLLYRIERDKSVSCLFVTSSHPLPLSALPLTLLEIFFEADVWMTMELDSNYRAQELDQHAHDQKVKGERPLSLQLSDSGQLKLAGFAIEKLKKDLNPLTRMAGRRAAQRLAHTSEMSPFEKRHFLGEIIDFYSPLEAYLLVSRHAPKAAQQKGWGSIEEQLLQMARALKGKKVDELVTSVEHSFLNYLQFDRFSALELDEYLRSVRIEPTQDDYYRSDEAKLSAAHDRRRANAQPGFNRAETHLVERILFKKIASQLGRSQRHLYFVKESAAFGQAGLLQKLEREGFSISRVALD